MARTLLRFRNMLTLANDSGATRSSWMTERVDAFASEIPEHAHPDVCVIGAGIAGLSVALALVQDGLDVLVLDMGPVGGGQTARTSAHLTSALDDYFHVLERRFGRSGAKLCYESHAAAIDAIEENIRTLAIDCDFRRVDGYLFSSDGKAGRLLDKELAAARRVGLVVARVETAPLPFVTGTALRFANQAEFHPLKYIRGLAAAIEAGGGHICTGVHVTDVTSGPRCKVTTADGRVIEASAVVDATNMAITSRLGVPLREAAYRTYVQAFEIPREYVPHGLYWDTDEPYHYVRVSPGTGGNELLLVGGEDHRVGQGDPETHFPRLEAWTRRRFPETGAVVASWSGQVQEPHDGMAYIGALPGHENIYVCTGDSGEGLTHGTIAGLLLPHLIQHRKHPWSRVYAPNRTRLHALGTFASESVKSTAPYADWLRGGDVESIDDIHPGHGATIRKGVHVLAVYKDERGQCTVRNARCPHLNAVVRWNAVEKSWDCPAHGSRFDCTGRVENGPAAADLAAAPVDLEAPTRAIPEPVTDAEPYLGDPEPLPV